MRIRFALFSGDRRPDREAATPVPKEKGRAPRESVESVPGALGAMENSSRNPSGDRPRQRGAWTGRRARTGKAKPHQYQTAPESGGACVAVNREGRETTRGFRRWN